jgi:hypothetical protein
MKGVSDRVYVQPPYSGRGKRNVSNLWNEIKNESGGRQSMLPVAPAEERYTASFDVALDLT